MRTLLVIFLFTSVAMADGGKVLWGAPASAPIENIGIKYSASNSVRVRYKVHNIVGGTVDNVTNIVLLVGSNAVPSTDGRATITTNSVLYNRNGRQHSVASLTNYSVQDIDAGRYRGWTYSNVLVVAVDWTAQLWTGTTYYIQNGVTDTYSAGIFCTTGVWTTESVQAAQLATNLWPGAQMLVISSNCLAYKVDSWEYWYNTYAMYAIQRCTPCGLSDVPETNAGTNTAKFNRWVDSFVRPITNYMAEHPEIRVVALSYGTPDHSMEQSPGGWNSTRGIIRLFYGYSKTGTDSGYYGHNVATNFQMFSFSCRTFDDTTNLLVRSSQFNICHEESGSVVWDAKGGYGAFDGYSWPGVNMTMLTNYFTDPSYIVYNYATKPNNVTLTNMPIIMMWSWGWYANSYGDNMFRTMYQFQPLPNSIRGSIESYSACSLYTNPDNSTRKHGQTRIYDSFSPTANFGGQAGADTNGVPLYSRTVGCAIGHPVEPYLGGAYTAEDFYPNMTKGYSFVECFYIMNAESKMLLGHIVCGHPFMRITDFAIENTTPWDVSGVWPVPY